MSSVIDLDSLSDRELMALHAATISKLKERGTVRTRNAPTGDYAESLIANAFDGTLAPNSAKSFDVQTADGRRLQVKSRQVIDLKRPGQRQFSAFRSFEFDALAVILFDHDYRVRAVRIPVDVVRDIARYIRDTNSHRGSTRLTRYSTTTDAPISPNASARRSELDAPPSVRHLGSTPDGHLGRHLGSKASAVERHVDIVFEGSMRSDSSE